MGNGGGERGGSFRKKKINPAKKNQPAYSMFMSMAA